MTLIDQAHEDQVEAVFENDDSEINRACPINEILVESKEIDIRTGKAAKVSVMLSKLLEYIMRNVHERVFENMFGASAFATKVHSALADIHPERIVELRKARRAYFDAVLDVDHVVSNPDAINASSRV